MAHGTRELGDDSIQRGPARGLTLPGREGRPEKLLGWMELLRTWAGLVDMVTAR